MSGLKHVAEVLVEVESASYHKLTARLRMNRVIFQGEIVPPFFLFTLEVLNPNLPSPYHLNPPDLRLVPCTHRPL